LNFLSIKITGNCFDAHPMFKERLLHLKNATDLGIFLHTIMRFY